MLQVVAQPVRGGMGAALPGAQQEPGAGAPAERLLPDVPGAAVAGGRGAGRDQGVELRAGEGQCIGAEFQQLVLHQQARKVPGRPLPAADPQFHRRVGADQQVVDPGVESGVRVGRVVVEEQPRRTIQAFQHPQQRRAIAGLRRIDAELCGDLLAELRERQRLSGKVDPGMLLFRLHPSAVLAEQGGLAIAGGCAQQGQALRTLCQLTQQGGTRQRGGGPVDRGVRGILANGG
ncbi:hypothetical protein D9M71_529280 [compost metagenome]